MKELLRNLITVNTFQSSDSFYFKNPPIVGTVNGKEAYCVFYYSHYDEYMVYALAWKGEGFDFHYLNENDMRPTYEHHFRTIDEDSGEFVPATDIVDILPNYMELIYSATQEKENIDFNEKYRLCKDRNTELQFYFEKVREEVGYNRYDESTYLSEYPMRLELNEYNLLHERYVNLKPDEKGEQAYDTKKAYSKEQILSEMAKEIKVNKMMDSIFNEILNEEND